MSTASFNEQYAIADTTDFTSADSTSSKAVTTSRTAQSRIDTVIVTLTETSSRVVNVFKKTNGGLEQLLGSVTVAASQGLSGTPGVDVLAAVLPASQVGILLPPDDQVTVGMASALTSGTLHVTAFGGTL